MSHSENVANQLDQAILEGLSMCRGVTQRYFAYLQGVEPTTMFPQGVQPTNEVGFTDTQGRSWFMKLDLVDDAMYKFPLEKCNAAVVKIMMTKIMTNLQLASAFVMANDIDPGFVLPRPELFKDAKLVITPFTSAFLYNLECGREMHDQFSKRIAFVWCEAP